MVEKEEDSDMSLTIQERIKDLWVESGLTLKEPAEQTGLSSSALGSYEADDTKDISHYALIKLAKFYGVTADYLLGLTETKHHPNADLADLRLSDDMIDILKERRVDTALLGELVAHPDFMKLLADISIYVNGLAAMQIHNLNAWVETVRAKVIKDYQPGEQDLEDVANFKGSRAETWLMLYCKQTQTSYHKLTEEEKQWLMRIEQKSKLAKGHVSQRGKKQK